MNKNIFLTLLMVLPLSSCSTVGYYYQGIHGHLSIMVKRKPVKKLLRNPQFPIEKKQRLMLAQEIRTFASKTLGLPDNDSYRSYVELNQSNVVWNVMAAPRFSLKPKTWCFPIVGCVSYRGYYSEADAKTFAATLDPKQFDRYISGSRAYSTLGWFDDPLTSPMINDGELALAELIFHELAHQVLYIKNDTAFNEAFASTVGEHGVRQWLKHRSPEKLAEYEQALQRKNDFVKLLNDTTSKLEAHYSSTEDKTELKQGKSQILQALQTNYNQLKLTHWDGHGGYDRWFEKPINNARLASIAVYRDQIPAFEKWLETCQGNFSDFYHSIQTISKLPADQRQKQLGQSEHCNPL